MRKIYNVKLSSHERLELFELIKKGKANKEKLNRARILLKADCGEEGEHWNDKKIAEAFYVTTQTVERTRQSLVEDGFEAALNRKPATNHRKRIIQGEEEAYLIALACAEPPEGCCRWTLKLLANKMIELNYIESVSPETIRTTLKKTKLSLGKKKEWCIPPIANAEFVCQMEETLDIYKRPYDSKKPVVCMDESSKQLTKEVRKSLPMMPGHAERYDTEYERNGTASIFMAFEPLQGLRFTSVTEQRTRVDWAIFIKNLVDVHYPDAKKIILVMDNLNTHHKCSLYEAFEPLEAKRIADRLEIHYTPKHGSWLNMAEIELSHLSRQCLEQRIGERSEMAAEVAAWTNTRNQKKVVANWQFTTDDARIKLRKLYPTI